MQAGTRERLLDAAAALFHARGYTAVGVQEVCQVAEANKGSFYHFFDSKESLMVSVILERRQMPPMFADGIPLELRPTELLILMYDAMSAEVTMQHRRGGHVIGCPIGSMAAEMAAQSEPLRDATETALQRMIDTGAEVVKKAIAEGELGAEEDPRATACRLVAYLQGATLLAKAKNDPSVLVELKPGYLQLLGIDPHVTPRKRSS